MTCGIGFCSIHFKAATIWLDTFDHVHVVVDAFSQSLKGKSLNQSMAHVFGAVGGQPLFPRALDVDNEDALPSILNRGLPSRANANTLETTGSTLILPVWTWLL